MIRNVWFAGVLLLIACPAAAMAQGYQDLIDSCKHPEFAQKCPAREASSACKKLEDSAERIPTAAELTALKTCAGATAGTSLHVAKVTAARGPGGAAVIAGGVQQFLVERAKAEVSMFATEYLRSKICAAEMKPFFESTCVVFEVSSVTDPVELSTLGAAFRRDLVSMPATLAKQLSSMDDKLACALEIGALAFGATRSGHELLIDSLATIQLDRCQKASFRFDGVKDLASRIKASAGALDLIDEGKYLLLLTLLYDHASASAHLMTFRPLLEALQNLLRTSNDRKQRVRALIVLVRQVAQVAISDAATRAQVESALDISERILNEDYSGAVVLILTNQQLLAVMNARTRDMARYLGLGAGIATATSSAEISKVLEQAAAPLGGWRRKHATSIGLSLSGFVGATLHRERLRSLRDMAAEPPDAWGAAPYLAVGIDLHKKLGDHERMGLFASLIDIGSVTSTRFSEDDPVPGLSVEDTPEIGFAQLFAPGAYLYVSLGRSPVVVGAGISYVPNLRRVDAMQSDGSIASDEVAVARLGVFLAVDVTLFPIVDR